MVSNREAEVSSAGVAEVDMKEVGEGVATMEEVEEATTTEGAEVEVEEEEEEGVADITHLATRAIADRKPRQLSVDCSSDSSKENHTLIQGSRLEPWLFQVILVGKDASKKITKFLDFIVNQEILCPV